MRGIFLLAIVLVATLQLALAGPGTHRYQKEGHSNYGDERNTEHIQEHIRAMVKSGADPVNLKNTDMVYYLFVLHDTNEDGHLDGHELRAAFTDFDDHEQDPTQYVSLEEITEMVDHVLEEDDLNGDGRISWEEYMESQLYHGNT